MPPFLKKNLAGIPVYLWVVLVVAAIGVGMLLRRRSQATAGVSDAYDSGESYGFPVADSMPIPGTAGGGSGGGGIGTTPEPVNGSGNADVIGAIGDLGTALVDSTAALAGAIAAQEPSVSPPAPAPAPVPTFTVVLPPAPAPVYQPPPEAPAPAPAPAPLPPATIATPAPTSAPGPVAGATFTWLFAPIAGLPGKSVWSMGDKPLFLRHLGARGLSYANWKANHLPAACRVFGDC